MINKPNQILSIVGKSSSGKTTLLEKIIPELRRRGYRVATIKHHAHPSFEIDQPGKDTWRFAQAGSDCIILAAPDKIASIRSLPSELSLDEIASGLSDVDIILTEGYKRAGKPSLEVLRSARSRELLSNPEQLAAIACDFELIASVPVFGIDDVENIVDWIERTFLL